MTQETLLQIGKLGLAIEDGANMVLDMYRVKEELTGADLFKGEPSEDRSHYAGYTELYKLPGMKDIADDAAEYIKNRLGEVIEEHCKSLEACISALGNAVTVKADKPDRKAVSITVRISACGNHANNGRIIGGILCLIHSGNLIVLKK